MNITSNKIGVGTQNIRFGNRIAAAGARGVGKKIAAARGLGKEIAAPAGRTVSSES